ncbi:MAG: gliding motility-associated C-terminal domain-containing protein [Sphingobacteriales bacterium]|nr:MAG: gliding motility-associated C-terminal domain-containing protein [Sphingobacteriales bacterium]
MLGCIGDNVAINLISDGGTYAWTGPNGFTSTQKSPIIQNATMASAGVYKVVVTSPFGCISTIETKLGIIPRPVVTVGNPNPAVCDGNAVELLATGGVSYKWSPAAGLSDPNIANPIANPTETTLYTVAVSNGTCETLKEVNVIVHNNPKAQVGEDKKILKGNSIMIEGIAEGDDITYFWSPAEGLDDPTKLNPIATPASDMTYTLNVVSNKGCVTATADIFIKVYEKVEVPSSFSPNGDGINDTWSIIAIDTFADPKVKIVNRYGEIVFESSGYKTPWDGKYKSSDVPPGVYYYIINLNTGLKPLSGSLTVIR